LNAAALYFQLRLSSMSRQAARYKQLQMEMEMEMEMEMTYV